VRIALPLSQPRLKPGAEYFLNVGLTQKQDELYAPAGHVVACEQLALPYATLEAPLLDINRLPTLTLAEENDAITVEGKGFKAVFSRSAGTLASLAYDGVETLSEGRGPRLNLFRALADNDRWMSRGIERTGIRNLSYSVKDVSVERVTDGIVRVRCTVDCAGSPDDGMAHTATFTVFGNGSVDVSNHVEPYGGLGVLPKLGVQIVLPRAFDTLTWLGRGPHESYVDRKRSAEVGLYSGTVADQYERYVRPQDNGNKTDVRWASLTDLQGNGLLVTTDGTYSISAHHNTADDFDQARHIHKVVPRGEVYLCIDAAHTGLGGASCGPRPLNEYILNAAPMRFRYCLRPATPDRATRARIQLPNLEAPSVTRDKSGMVRIESSVAGKIEFRLDDGSWKAYTSPFEHSEQGTLQARVRLDNDLTSDVADAEFDKIVPLLDLDKSTWKVTHADSIEPGEGEVRHAIDNDPATFWHTNWSSTQEKHPHEIRIDLGQAVRLLGFSQLPRQDSANGRIGTYEFYVSGDGQQWGSAVSKGRFPNSGRLQTVKFEKPVTGRYIRLVTLNEWSGQYYTTIAELDVMAAK